MYMFSLEELKYIFWFVDKVIFYCLHLLFQTSECCPFLSSILRVGEQTCTSLRLPVSP